MRELTSPEEQTLLQKYASGLVLEIGSYDGASAIALSKVCQAVHCVDPFLPDPGSINVNPSLERFIGATRKYPNIHLHYGRSLDILPLFQSRYFDLIFIDGAHFYMAVMFDILSSLRLVKKEGFIALHDREWPEVKQAIENSRLDAYAEAVEQVGALIMYKTDATDKPFPEWASTDAIRA